MKNICFIFLICILAVDACSNAQPRFEKRGQVIFGQQDAAIMRNEKKKYKACPPSSKVESCYDEETQTYRLYPRPF